MSVMTRININSQNQDLSQFVVKRDGFLDWNYTNELINNPRTEALQGFAKLAITECATRSLKALAWAGKGLINATDDLLSTSRVTSSRT